MLRFSPFRVPDSRDFAKLNLLFKPNLVFEIGYSYVLTYVSSEGLSPLKQYTLLKKKYSFRSSLRAKLQGTKFDYETNPASGPGFLLPD